jgi:hypothetical protein
MRLADEFDGFGDHLAGEAGEAVGLDSFSGKVQVRWDPGSPVTAMGQMVFFIEFLKTCGVFDAWIEGCPLSYTSPNAPSKRDVLGTMLLGIVAGHWRYAHMSALRCDEVNAGLLGMKRVMSEDSVRRAFAGQNEADCTVWMGEHLRNCWEPLLMQPWILDLDTTIRTIYGHQEGARIGYNPHRRNRPSHVYNVMVAMPMRIVLEVDVHPGNHCRASYMTPRVWQLVDSLPPSHRPSLIRGDCLWGSDTIMRQAEERGLKYVFKIGQTTYVKRLIRDLFKHGQWVEFDAECEAAEAQLKLYGWESERRVVIVRRRIKGDVAVLKKGATQPEFFDASTSIRYEYAAIITNLEDDVRAVVRLYRDRAASENVFDELKNQWSWSGFVTRDMLRCQIMARTGALVYNWWTLFTRLVLGDRHREALTTRPLLLHAIAKQSTHARQLNLTITTTHAKGNKMKALLLAAHRWLQTLIATAEQLTNRQRWEQIIRRVFELLTPKHSPQPTGFASNAQT